MQDWNKEYILHSILGIDIDYDPFTDLKKSSKLFYARLLQLRYKISSFS